MFSSQTSIRRRMRVLFTLSLEGSAAPASPARSRRTPSPSAHSTSRRESIPSFHFFVAARLVDLPSPLVSSHRAQNDQTESQTTLCLFIHLQTPILPTPFLPYRYKCPYLFFIPALPVHDRNAASSFLSCAYALCPCTTGVGGVRTFKHSNLPAAKHPAHTRTAATPFPSCAYFTLLCTPRGWVC
jgi:hypothetical protein